MYNYNYPQYEETVTVTETFYDEEGRVTKEIVTETRKSPINQSYVTYNVSQ